MSCVGEWSMSSGLIWFDPFNISLNPSNNELTCYNVVAGEVRSLKKGGVAAGVCDMLTPERSIPVRPGSLSTRSHSAMHLLGQYITLILCTIRYDINLLILVLILI